MKGTVFKKKGKKSIKKWITGGDQIKKNDIKKTNRNKEYP